MIYPPIFATALASPGVTSLLGAMPLRLYLFGEATQATTKPYAVWQMIFGSPENYIGNLPDADDWGIQIDVYGTTASQSRAVALALRTAFEPVAYVTAYNGEFKESNTNLYRYSFQVEWITHRT